MANIYVRSTDGSDADSGATWALAKATSAGAAGIDAAGDTVYISDNHAESVATSNNAWAGTQVSPVRIICGDDAAEPPTAVATTATLTTTGTTFSWTGACNIYNLTFIWSSGSSYNPSFNAGATSASQVHVNCVYRYTGAATGAAITFGSATASIGNDTELRNPSFRLAATGQRILIGHTTRIMGGQWESGGTTPVGIFNIGNNNRPAQLYVDGFDFSNLGSTVNLVASLSDGSNIAVFRNCKLPASWTGSIYSGGLLPGTRVEMWNCDSGATNYRFWIKDYTGDLKSNSSVYKTGFAWGGTAHSMEMATSANTSYLCSMLISPDLVANNTVTGSSVTATVEICHDGAAAFKDDEIWMELMYMSSSGTPIGSWINDTKADILASGTAQSTSSEAWTGASGTGPNGSSTWNTLKLSVSFTPQQAGYVIANIYMAVPSKTVYVDPGITLT